MSDALLESEDTPILDHDAREECADPDCHGWIRRQSTKEVIIHQPAARGGGEDEWRVLETGVRTRVINAKGQTVANGCGYSLDQRQARAAQIATEHNQHQALVAERERWQRLLTAAQTALSTPGMIRGRETLQKAVDAINEQRSTSE